MSWHLTLMQAPTLRLDLRALQPALLKDLSRDELLKLPLPHGNERIALGQFFDVQPNVGETLVLEGDDLRWCDRIGFQLREGRIEVHGDAGDWLGAGMAGGELLVQGDAGVLAGCEMSGGRLYVGGDVGECAASAQPGSMDGMRGGRLVVGGDAGPRFGDRMRRGTAVVYGNAGDFCGSRMVAGTIAVAGGWGAHPGWGMRRGTLVALNGSAVQPAPTFVPTGHDLAVAWQLLARELARFGGVFATLPKRRVQRHAGDVAVDGRGELLRVM
jgi:formylmethanofuran dehydrogenase subunit C